MACRAAGWGSLARFAVDCKLSVLRHVSRDTSWDTVECWVPQQWWSTISLSAVDYRPMSTVLNALQEKDRSRPEVSLSGQNWETLQLTAKADSPLPRDGHAAADRTARVTAIMKNQPTP